MISRLDRTALEWAYDARYLTPRRSIAPPASAPPAPRDLNDKIVLSPAALRLLDQAQRLAQRSEV
jgi:hypothetical protein